MIKTRKLLTVVITVVMLLQSIGFSGFAAVGTDNFKDFPNGSWSEEAMIAAVENGLLVGTSDTTIEPKKNLTRAEFAAIITRAFGATEKADISNFKDVDAGKWYAEPIAKAVQMGVMNGTGTTTFDPNAFMKREDVILALARVLFVDGDDTSVLEQFSDRDKIDTWSVKAIAGMVNEGYVNGYEDGTIRPLNFITREELAQLFHNIFKTYISEDGEFNSVAKKGSVIVRSKYVTLKDVTIDGDLIMADGIGGGDFRISNVHVTGKIIARGGEGMNYFVNVTSDGKVIVNDPNGTVNFYNYREEDTPFKGGNVIENTPATFLERKKDQTPSIGGGTTYKLTFKDINGDDVKTVSKTNKNYVITDGNVPTDAQMAEDGYIFKGWSTDKNATSGESRDYFIDKKIGDVKGTWYPVYVEGYEVVFYADDTVGSPVKTETGVVEASYVIQDSDVPADADMEKSGFEFQGWSQQGSVEVKNRTYFVGKNASEVKGEWYPVYVKLTVYKVSFKYNDGTDALAAVEKTLKPSEDHVLTNADVKDVAHPTAPADYKFIGWSETANDTTNVVSSAELQVSIKTLDGKTYYAQFEKVTDNYTVVFKYTDGTEISRVEKTLSDSENYVLTNADVKDVDYHTNPADYTFLGWTDTVSGTDYKTSAELRVSIKDLDGKTYYAQYERNETTYSVSFKYEDGTEALSTVEKNLVASEDYVLTNADVKDVVHPTSPADYKFLGWAEAGSTTVLTSAELQVSIKSLDGKTFYAQFERDETSYSVSFKYEDGTEALATVEKNLVASEDYVLTNADVKDVAHPTAPADYKFIGWAEAGSSVVLTSAELQVSIRDLDGKTYYAQFEEITDVYTIIFKDNDENELATLTKNENESIADSEIPAVTVDASSLFKGWATTKGATTVEFDNALLASDVVANIFSSTTVTLYPVIVDKDAVEYFVEHYFEDLDGNYVLDNTKTQSGFEIPGKTVTAAALTVEHYEENLTHADRLEEGVIPDAPEVLTLKFFYDLEVLKVNYYDLYFDENSPVLEYEVKYGGTIDNFCYPGDDFDAAVNEDIKNEISDYVEYLKMAGYGKDYNDEYFYPLFEDKLGGAYEPMYPHFNYPYEHAISFKWYVEDDVEEFVVFDESHVFTEDLDLYSKVKKLNVEFILPEKLSGGMPLIINVPYEESTRFLDSVRDALFINDNIATYPDTTGLEEKFYEKMSNVGGKVFGDDGVFNSNNEINNTDIFVYFYQLMGGKAKYREWLWEEVETEVENSLGPRGKDLPRSQYESLRSMGLNQEQALYTFFIENKFGLDFTGELAFAFGRYIDSKKFIDMSSNEDKFLVTVNNEFIMEKVEEKVESLASVDSVITEYGGGRVPEGLLNRLPMDIIEDVYEPRVQRFLNQLDDARAAAANGEPEENCMVDSGIYFDVNLIDEILVPGMEFAKESHEKAVNKAVNSNNKGAKLVEKYYVDNPYVTGEAGNYGVVNYAFEPSFYVTKTGNVDANGYSMYKINSFESIYKEMVMPESVETIDSLLWLLDPNGGAVDFANIRKLAEDNEDLILALHNHPHALMADYAVNGLPENMEEYWEDLLSDPEIKKAVEKLDNNVSFDMMFFVESKIQNATLEMYYLKVLDKAGVPVENILSKYTNSKAYKELTSADFHKLLDQLEECWETVEIDGKPVVNANGTTDYVFDNVLEKVGSSGDVATASVKGFEVIITRFFADDLFQNAPNN